MLTPFSIPEYRLVIPSAGIATAFALLSLAGCGEPVFENAGSPNSLLEDREACVMEME